MFPAASKFCGVISFVVFVLFFLCIESLGPAYTWRNLGSSLLPALASPRSSRFFVLSLLAKANKLIKAAIAKTF